MKKRRATFLYSAGLCFTLITTAVFGTLTAVAERAEVHTVSPALSVIAESNGMAMAGLIGNSIEFEA